MTYILEQELPGTSKGQAGGVTKAIRMLAGLPLAFVLVFFEPLVLIAWPVLRWAINAYAAFVAQAGLAAIFISSVNWVFNYPFTIWAVTYPNPVMATVVWLVAGVVLNYACVVWYKRTTKDWFGFERLRMEEAIHSGGFFARIVRFSLRKSRLVAFVLISILFDPIYGFMYQRGRASGPRFNLGDWWWFCAANILGMLPWLVGAVFAVELWEEVVRIVKLWLGTNLIHEIWQVLIRAAG